MFRFAYLLLMVPQETTAEKDVYAIYSLVLTNPQTSHGPDDNERYLIAATTAPGRPQEPCVRLPQEREAAFREVLADYERRKATPRQLQRALSIRKLYILLSADDVKAFIKARSLTRPVPEPESERFRGVTDVFTLSDVYFNQHRTLALTSISSWCGSLCGLYQWKVFEKLDTGKWEERQWGTCVTVAKNSDERPTCP